MTKAKTLVRVVFELISTLILETNARCG